MLGEGTKKLGFGLMRLPKLEDSTIDVEQTKKMVDMFMEAGLTYFDTAFVYTGSEEATREALVKRYPRESYTLASKLNAWHGEFSGAKAAQQLDISLERTQAGYFDYYLLHSIKGENIKAYDDNNYWDFVKEAKAAGKIKHYGISFHGTPELLEEVLTKHPDIEFVQLQLNYADWENPIVASRRNYEIVRKHGKPIIVMEPVKGGTLANPPQKVIDLLKGANPEASLASWAIRYAASLEGVMVVLSGMSNVEQMADNLSYMKDFKPLSESEQATIKKAQAIIDSIENIPCTACKYCVEGCPMNIPIPDIFAARNKQMIWGKMEEGQKDYENKTKETGKASDCIQCGQCEGACPQGLQIISLLQKASEVFGF